MESLAVIGRELNKYKNGICEDIDINVVLGEE